MGLDALLGEQKRPHDDVDIVIEHRHVDPLVEALGCDGFSVVPGGRHFNFVLTDGRRREVDVHTVVFDDATGHAWYGPDGLCYEAGSLEGVGLVAGRTVACCTAEFQVASHSGYELDDDDLHDVHALAERFGLPLRPEHRRG